jgi:hypothetical protein
VAKNELAGEDGSKKLELTQVGVMALADMLSRTEPQGRVEIRKHAKLFSVLNSRCRRFNDEARTQFTWVPGIVECDDSTITYLTEMLHARTSHGVPGMLSEGYAELLDRLGDE